MRRLSTCAIVGLLAAVSLPSVAAAVEGFTTDAVTMYAGPGTAYPEVATIEADQSVEIHGCLADWTWCDVSWRDDRGWIAGDDVVAELQGQRVVVLQSGPQLGLSVVTFDIGSYWELYYPSRPFFTRIEEFREVTSEQSEPEPGATAEPTPDSPPSPAPEPPAPAPAPDPNNPTPPAQ